MIWLTWRLHRTESLIGLAVIAVLGLALTVTGLDIANTYRTMGLEACVSGADRDEDAVRACNQLTNAFFQEFDTLRSVVQWLNFLPVIVAMLLAAPFLNELEHGAFRMSWTQSMPRARWAAYRIGAILVAAALLGAIWRTVMTWWLGPFSEQQGRFPTNDFNFQGIVPIAYVVFAAALILAAGSISRRTVATLVVVLVVFLPVRLGIESKLRPRYQEPLTAVADVDPQLASLDPATEPRDWIVGRGFVDELGNRLSESDFESLCPPSQARDESLPVDCIASHGIRTYEDYQPASRFWRFQLIESAIYLSLATALVALSFWWITRRLA